MFHLGNDGLELWDAREPFNTRRRRKKIWIGQNE